MFINMVNPWSLLTALFVTIGFVYIGKYAKNSYVVLMPVIGYILVLLMHIIQYIFNMPISSVQTYAQCILVDCILLYASYISYLWVNEVEGKSKKLNKKKRDE